MIAPWHWSGSPDGRTIGPMRLGRRAAAGGDRPLPADGAGGHPRRRTDRQPGHRERRPHFVGTAATDARQHAGGEGEKKKGESGRAGDGEMERGRVPPAACPPVPLHGRTRHTVIMVTHEARAAAFTDAIYFLKDGVVVGFERLDGKHDAGFVADCYQRYEAPARTSGALTVAAVALGVALVVAIAGTHQTLRLTLFDSIMRWTGPADLRRQSRRLGPRPRGAAGGHRQPAGRCGVGRGCSSPTAPSR